MPPTDSHVEASPLALASGEVVGSRGGPYLGFSVRETSGSAGAIIILYDNVNGASGPILEEITLNPNESARENYPRPGRLIQNGIFAAITGSVEGSVFQ